jgi:glycosyltransferase involved in cell wall biosynthesis
MDGDGVSVRLIWLSNAPWAPSGYGEQTAMFVPRLAALGHDMAIAANYGIMGTTTSWQDMPVYSAAENWGNDGISTFAQAHKADLVIALCDAWVMKPKQWADDLHMAIWTPVDHYPIPPAVMDVLKHPKVRPIAMSRFGEAWMKTARLDPLYVPHGVDTSVFKPHPEHKAAARKALSIPEDAFLVGMVAANKGNPSFPRKSFPQAFDAFATFAKRHRDAYLYVHTQANPPSANVANGIDLLQLAKAVEFPHDGHSLPKESWLGDRICFPPESAWHLNIMDKNFVSGVYAACDVLLNPSMGEGFGVPIIEAQACGVPVIASDHSAMSELVQAGWLVTGDRWWDSLQGSFAFVPSIGSIENALEAAYESRADAKLRDAAAEFAREYDADLVTERYWKPALEELAKPREIPPLKVVAQNGNRAQRRAAARAKAQA